MSARESIRHCPGCGAALPPAIVPAGPVDCPACGYVLFVNPAIATAAFVLDPSSRVLLIRRAREPGRGKLAPPGGFIDAGETAEEAIRRELREEVGIEIDSPVFLGSHPNRYAYKGITYDVLDLFFTAHILSDSTARPLDEVEDVNWFPVRDVRPEDLAFPSMQAAWGRFLEAGFQGT